MAIDGIIRLRYILTKVDNMSILIEHKFFDNDITGVLVDTEHLEAKAVELRLNPDYLSGTTGIESILLNEDDILALAAHFANPTLVDATYREDN